MIQKQNSSEQNNRENNEAYSPGTKAQDFTKEALDDLLRELGKCFRKLNGNKMPAEIILVGGASVIVGYGFRNRTSDIDALIQASSAMSMAIDQVGDRYGMPKGWLNQDFKKTDSYSPKIVQYSVHYKTFSNIMEVRTLPAEYLAAMKLASFRAYKYDKSDIIGIIAESGINRDQIETAITNLYGSFDKLTSFEAASLLLDEIYKSSDKKALYMEYRKEEQQNYSLLKNINTNYPGLLKSENVNDVLAAARRKLAEQK
ncbi:MAG: hypothetical protein IKI75_00010 [Lachnospiraceae bacterium]|nr:hypothetical protein [Lachnospiraceae bacterium]